MKFQKMKTVIVVFLASIVIITASAEKSDNEEKLSNSTPESVIEDLRNSTSSGTEGISRVKRQFGGYGYGYPYYGRRRILPYPPIIVGGIGVPVVVGRGFGGRGFGGRGFGGRGIGGRGFGGKGGGFGGRGGGIGGGRGGRG